MPAPALTTWEDIAAIVGAAIALAALAKGVWEYGQQGAQKRAEHFLVMRQRFKANVSFKTMCDLLETDDPVLADVPFKEKRDLLGFFEEVALMLNSSLIRTEVAHYMFGYYAIRCWRSENFWKGVNRDSPYWSLFRDFAVRMERRERAVAFRRRDMRF